MDPSIFYGELKNYPTFQEVWASVVKEALEDFNQCVLINMKVPESDKLNISNIGTMTQVYIDMISLLYMLTGLVTISIGLPTLSIS